MCGEVGASPLGKHASRQPLKPDTPNKHIREAAMGGSLSNPMRRPPPVIAITGLTRLLN